MLPLEHAHERRPPCLSIRNLGQTKQSPGQHCKESGDIPALHAVLRDKKHAIFRLCRHTARALHRTLLSSTEAGRSLSGLSSVRTRDKHLRLTNLASLSCLAARNRCRLRGSACCARPHRAASRLLQPLQTGRCQRPGTILECTHEAFCFFELCMRCELT